MKNRKKGPGDMMVFANYQHLLLRIAEQCRVDIHPKEISSMSSVQLVASLFDLSTKKVARDVAQLMDQIWAEKQTKKRKQKTKREDVT